MRWEPIQRANRALRGRETVDNINQQNTHLVDHCLIEYNNWISVELISPIKENLRIVPLEIETLIKDIQAMQQLARRIMTPGDTIGFAPPPPEHMVVLTDKQQSYLKRAILHQIQIRSFDMEKRIALTNNPDLRTRLESEVQEVRDLTTGDWFNNVEPYKTPKLTDFITIEQAVEQETVKLQNRQYDEKFHILTAPELFPYDIRYYRTNCELRSRPVTLAFIDIDNFKQFNETHGEGEVDLRVLPKFMSELEKHVYSHGHAYRYGGDEYVIILSNMDCAAACTLLCPSSYKLEQTRA
jgi:hypothetical protein